MIVILHKILFNGSISDHKNTFYDFFSGVQYVSPTFKAGSLVCDTQHLLWQSVLTIYTYRIRSTLSQTWSQINIPIIWFLNLFNSKKGQYIFERHKNWDCNSSNCKKKSTKKPIFISYFGRQLSLKQCGTLVVKRVCLPQIRAAAKLKWVYLCCCGWIYSLTSFEVIVHIGKGGGI